MKIDRILCIIRVREKFPALSHSDGSSPARRMDQRRFRAGRNLTDYETMGRSPVRDERSYRQINAITSPIIFFTLRHFLRRDRRARRRFAISDKQSEMRREEGAGRSAANEYIIIPSNDGSSDLLNDRRNYNRTYLHYRKRHFEIDAFGGTSAITYPLAKNRRFAPFPHVRAFR